MLLQEYTDADNKRQRPIMIHRAVFGSIERFFGILIENFAGAFPLWMAPVQVLQIQRWEQKLLLSEPDMLCTLYALKLMGAELSSIV